jgi:hypothetical protein
MVLRNTTTPAKRLYLLGAIVLLSGVVLLLNWARQTQPFIQATTHQPERYTELYFTDPNDLTSAVQDGQVLPVSFKIHNVEARSMTYAYKTEFTDSSGRVTVLDQRQLSLPNGSTKIITDDTTLPSFNGRGEISVVLLNQPEAIHFWLMGS